MTFQLLTYSLPVGWLCKLACKDGNAEAFWISGGTFCGLRPPIAPPPCRLLGGMYTPPLILVSAAATGSDDSDMGMEIGKIQHEVWWKRYLLALISTHIKLLGKSKSGKLFHSEALEVNRQL